MGTYNQSGSRALYTTVQRKTMRAAEMAVQKSNSSASQMQRISSADPRDSKSDEYDMPATETTEEMKKKSRSSASNKHPGVTLDPEDEDALHTRVAELVRAVSSLDLQESQRQRLGQALERLRELVLAGGRLDKVPAMAAPSSSFTSSVVMPQRVLDREGSDSVGPLSGRCLCESKSAQR